MRMAVSQSSLDIKIVLKSRNSQFHVGKNHFFVSYKFETLFSKKLKVLQPHLLLYSVFLKGLERRMAARVEIGSNHSASESSISGF